MKKTRLIPVVFVMAALAATWPAGAMAATRASAPAVNLIKDPGAEQAKPNSSGSKVNVPGWNTINGSQFTAVAYNTAGGFPTSQSPGPKNRGKNFFAGGAYGNTSGGTQLVSLTQYRQLIRSGKAVFTLAAWLGGYDSQGDYATLTVTWRTSAGKALGHSTIGPVTPAQRDDITGMLFRSAAGKVPPTAASALLTLYMVREEGTYIDGYADNLSLTIQPAA